MNFNNLPTAVQDEVKSTLGAYSKTSVYKKANGDFYETTVVVLHNGEYDEFIAEYTAEQVFTLEERIVNYVKSFREYPFHVSYKGKKDYKALGSNWTNVEMEAGNLIFS